MSKMSLLKHLKTCCWHEDGHKYGHFTDTGDYVLSQNVLSTFIPSDAVMERAGPLFSDHQPVIARIC
jgi:hypothetical protein